MYWSINTLLSYQKQPPNESNSKEAPAGSILMAHSQNGNVIQMLLFQSIPSRPRAQGERVGYIFINILDPNYVFTPPKTPAKRPQQRVSAPSMLSGDCLPMLTYPALPEIPPAHPAIPSGTLGKPTILPAYPGSLLLILTSPGTTAVLGFFGWWGIPAVDL